MDVAFVQRCLRWLGNCVITEYIDNEEALPKTLCSRIQNFFDTISSKIEWENLTAADAHALGFILWNQYPTYDVWLIPTYLYPAIPQGTELVMVYENNKSCTYVNGYDGYGIKIKSSNNIITTDEETIE